MKKEIDSTIIKNDDVRKQNKEGSIFILKRKIDANPWNCAINDNEQREAISDTRSIEKTSHQNQR